MPSAMFLAAALLISSSQGLAFLEIKFGTQLSCQGNVEGSANDSIEVILQNQWSLDESEPVEWPNVAMVWLKSQISAGGSWFGVIPTEVVPEQLFWVYRHSDVLEEITKGSYGAKLVLSSAKPLLEIINPNIKMEITIARGEVPDTIKLAGYFAVKDPDSGEALVVTKLDCSIEPATAQL